MSEQKRKRIEFTPFQDDFVYSDKRYPAFVAGWGTGKTMCAIARGMRASQEHPGNLGLIVRKEFTDLRDSTMKDFEVYTGYTIGSDKEVVTKEGSTIMFRHGDELDVLQNINLGWFVIEQAEEFETDEQFQMLRGRLRRDGVPHFGAVIANTKGHNWIWKLWKKADPKRSEEYILREATSFDNKSNLPADFIEDLKHIEKESPSHYNRFVLNSWEDLDVEDKVIPYSAIQAAIKRELRPLRVKRLVACDPAEFGNDETVIFGMESGKIIARDVFTKKEPMETAGRIIKMKREIESHHIVIDPIGVGSGIRSRLNELGHTVISADGRAKAADPKKDFNCRTEIWFAGRDRLIEGNVSLPDDDDLLTEELAAVGYQITSKGQRKVDPKEKIKKADYLGHSPSRAEAYIYGLWAESGIEYADELIGLEDESIESTELADSYSVKSVL